MEKKLKRCLEWLKYCLSIGYDKSVIPALKDLWMNHHDENGEVIKSANSKS